MVSTESTWRLGRRPALDGLRGVAVLLVVVSHLSEPNSWVRQFGMVGVTVFFTLSGFLITSILLEQHATTGRMDFPRFYRARFMRLAPAMLVCVAIVTALGGLLGPGYATPRLALGAVTCTSNWSLAFGAAGNQALVHTWSLSVEEQFYLLWPVTLLLLGRFGRRWLIAAMLAGIAASVASPFLLAAPDGARVYFGSDTHANSLLIGCLLAVLMHRGRERASRPALAAVALGLSVLASAAPLGVVVLLGPPLVGLGTAAVIFWTAQDIGARWLTHPALTYLGVRSYGLYLWHWPLIVLSVQLVGVEHWRVASVIALPFAALATACSWRFVEAPESKLRGWVDGWLPRGRRHPNRSSSQALPARQLEPDPAT
jgi:peptidoglycan/LPS O-acetylase OafA/YrhL